MEASWLWEGLLPLGLVMGLSLLWALAEIVQTFAGDLRRALATGWAWFFIGTHLLLAPLVYLVLRRAFFPKSDPLRVALLAGLGWQLLLRTRSNLIQPIQAGGDGVPFLALADLYGRFQRFCRAQINQALLGKRMALLERALNLPQEVLEQQVEILLFASRLPSQERVEAFLTKVRNQPDERRRKLLLASFLLNESGFASFQSWLDAQQKQPRDTG